VRIAKGHGEYPSMRLTWLPADPNSAVWPVRRACLGRRQELEQIPASRFWNREKFVNSTALRSFRWVKQERTRALASLARDRYEK
jgi:hypothetical protein